MSETEIEAGDVVGQVIFNEERGMGLGRAIERKTARNLRGDERDVFVCVGPDGNETLRDVSDVLRDVNEYGYELYDEHPWGDGE